MRIEELLRILSGLSDPSGETREISAEEKRLQRIAYDTYKASHSDALIAAFMEAVEEKKRGLGVAAALPLATTTISVVPLDTLDAAHELFMQTGTNPCVLDMASSIQLGGGWKTGQRAQEEEIARRTNFLVRMADQVKSYKTPWDGRTLYYGSRDGRRGNAKDGVQTAIATGPGVMVDGVICFRGSGDYRFAVGDHASLAFELDLVVAAAPDFSKGVPADAEGVVRARVVALLDGLVAAGKRNIVLGA